MVTCPDNIARIVTFPGHYQFYLHCATPHHRARMATIAGLNLSTPRVLAKATDKPKAQALVKLNQPWRRTYHLGSGGRMQIRPVRAAPDSISEKVEKSIKDAEAACSDDAASGECAAAWDEVEELSAAASHAKDKKKGSDPLEEYCKDNPETDECRTYED
ncbi:calvin cycle protein CP12-1, chloroplastic [Populus trichocarpa]|nr:calvin cycle protein CP12-1, chloroplastic [Populus trichocarpa]